MVIFDRVLAVVDLACQVLNCQFSRETENRIVIVTCVISVLSSHPFYNHDSHYKINISTL